MAGRDGEGRHHAQCARHITWTTPSISGTSGVMPSAARGGILDGTKGGRVVHGAEMSPPRPQTQQSPRRQGPEGLYYSASFACRGSASLQGTERVTGALPRSLRVRAVHEATKSMMLLSDVTEDITVKALQDMIHARAESGPPHPDWPEVFALEVPALSRLRVDRRLLPLSATLRSLSFRVGSAENTVFVVARSSPSTPASGESHFGVAARDTVAQQESVCPAEGLVPASRPLMVPADRR